MFYGRQIIYRCQWLGGASWSLKYFYIILDSTISYVFVFTNPHQFSPISTKITKNKFMCKDHKKGQKHGFDPSLRKDYVKRLLACRTLEPILKVG